MSENPLKELPDTLFNGLLDKSLLEGFLHQFLKKIFSEELSSDRAPGNIIARFSLKKAEKNTYKNTSFRISGGSLRTIFEEIQ